MTRFLIAFILSWLVIEVSGAAERLPCSAERLGPDWHYRTKIPGFTGNVRDDRCWYDGPAMKSRHELFWPDAAPEKAKDELARPAPRLPTPTEIRTPQRPSWELERRWVDPSGWSHQE